MKCVVPVAMDTVPRDMLYRRVQARPWLGMQCCPVYLQRTNFDQIISMCRCVSHRMHCVHTGVSDYLWAIHICSNWL